MSASDGSALFEWFRRLCEMPPEESDRTIRELDGSDPELAARLRAMLAADRTDSSLLGSRLPRQLAQELVDRARTADASVDTELARLAAWVTPADRFSARGELGRGAMGVVDGVWDAALEREVARKTLSADGSGPRFVARLLFEARVTGNLVHPGIVPVHDLGVDASGTPFFTMQKVRGRTLHEVYALERRGDEGWTRARVLGVLQRVCDAVAYAHSLGVIHRDLKPANVMVGEFGETYVMDWGLARHRGHADLVVAEASERGAAADSSRLTIDGDVLGTPQFMAPEQAAGRIEEVDERSDVYAVGVMLYELLTGHRPFERRDEQPATKELLRRIQEEEPTPIADRRDVPPELAAICAKAMARDRSDRYADMRGLADDLRAFLEDRVVQAHRTGALVELQKWVRRNRLAAAALAMVVVVTVAGALIAMASEARVRQRTEEFDQLASAVQHEELVQEEARLYPAWPDHISALRSWLSKCDSLLMRRPQLDATIRELESRALPRSAEEVESERQTHPRHDEWVRLRAKAAAAEQMQAVRADPTRYRETALPAELDAKTPESLLETSVRLCDRDEARHAWGDEGLALACARRALERTDAVDKAPFADAVAQALFWNGLDDQALAMAERAIEMGSPAAREERAALRERLRSDIEGWHGEAGATKLSAIRSELAELDEIVTTPRSFRFAADQNAARFLHDTLRELRARLDVLETGLRGRVVDRLQWAERIDELTRNHPNAPVTWAEARDAIARSERYRDPPIPDLRPQMGLVPLGANPKTGLWEFYDLRSAWDGESDPATIPIPHLDADGRIAVHTETGMVFVLLPGGSFRMGLDPTEASRDDETAAADKLALPVREVQLAPFFLATHEVTQAQWARLWVWDDIHRRPSMWCFGTRDGTDLGITETNPVERVSWDECEMWLHANGLELPTEAQFEYACRAGTTTPWSCPREELDRYANVADVTVKGRANFPYDADLDDHYATHAPVGSYEPNRFGVYDMLGNVSEWCLDPGNNSYATPGRPGDGLRVEGNPTLRVRRGGNFGYQAVFARSGFRAFVSRSVSDGILGVRAARPLQR